MIQIMILDDHPLVIEGLKSMFDTIPHIHILQSFTQSHSLLTALEQQQPDIIFMDIDLNERIDGIVLTKQILKLYPHISIIGLSSFHQIAIIRQMLKNGASGYLLKNVGTQELNIAIDSVMKGEIYVTKEVRALLNQEIPDNAYLPQLTRREKEILSLIVKEYTTKEIADALFVSVATVETHRVHLFQKLGVKNVVGLVKLALEKGLVDEK